MLKFYFNGAPNPNKVALFLEESGLPYELVPVDTRKGEQFKPEFLKVNPNGKVPAIDDDGVFVFDSNAILLYLAEKTGKFLPQNSPTNRAQMLSWLMFIATGLGPYSGQAVHFKHFAPKDLEYAHNRYQFARDRAQGQVHLQDRDGRGSARLHVRPPQDQGGLTICIVHSGARARAPRNDIQQQRPAVVVAASFAWKAARHLLLARRTWATISACPRHRRPTRRCRLTS
jgi:hypothetical protein